MKIVERKEVIEKVINTYIAKDGKEFNNERDCLWYERRLEVEESRNEADRFKIESMDNCIPINTNDFMSESSYYRWYKVENENDLHLLEKAYEIKLTVPKTYPEIICIEEYDTDCYDYYMSNMFEVTKRFWKNLGYEITFNNIVL